MARVAGRAGLWGVPPTWVWVVGFNNSLMHIERQIVSHENTHDPFSD